MLALDWESYYGFFASVWIFQFECWLVKYAASKITSPNKSMLLLVAFVVFSAFYHFTVVLVSVFSMFFWTIVLRLYLRRSTALERIRKLQHSTIIYVQEWKSAICDLFYAMVDEVKTTTMVWMSSVIKSVKD